MQQQLVNRFNSLIVSLYKAVGTLALTLIMVGLVSYLAVQAFFLVGRSWLMPTVLSPSDERIFAANARLAQQNADRDRLMAERRELVGRIAQSRRITAAQRAFQARFAAALRSERTARTRDLRQLLSLRSSFKNAHEEIVTSNQAYVGVARVRAQDLKEAQLLTREGYLTQNYQLAQIASANLSFAEREVDLQRRVGDLKRQLEGLQVVAEGRTEDVEVTKEALLLEQELVHSRLEVARAEQDAAAAEAALAALDKTLARYDALLDSISGSPYMQALQRNLTVAFVPYENLDNAAPGTPLYGCRLGMLWCEQVGTVHQVLEGEVISQHPIRQQQMRGVMVEMKLNDPLWARRNLLHAGRPPLFF